MHAGRSLGDHLDTSLASNRAYIGDTALRVLLSPSMTKEDVCQCVLQLAARAHDA